MATKSIGATGRDFATLALWASYLTGLGTLAAPEIGQGFNDGEFTSAGVVMTITGVVTDATNTITLTTGTGQSFRDDAGAASNPLIYDQTKGVGIRRTANYSQATLIQVANVTLSNLQIKGSGGANNAVEIQSGGVIDSCICMAPGDKIVNFSGASGKARVLRNSVVIKSGSGNNIAVAIGYDSGKIDNNTIVCSSTASGTGIQSSGSPVAINNVVMGFSAASSGSWSLTSNRNNVSDLSSGLGTDASNLYSKTYANQFVSVSADFRLKTGADCIDAGQTDSTNVPSGLDIIGTARPSGAAWDVGAWEFVAVATSLPPGAIMM